MIYAYEEGNDKLIVTAASSLAEFDDFYTRAVAVREGYVSETQPDIMAMLTEPNYQRLKRPPYVFEHLSPTQRREFADRYGINILGPNACIDRAVDMIEYAMGDIESAKGEADTRTIAQVLGIDEYDPFDKRSEEQKEKEAQAKEAYKKAYDEAAKKGALSGDSFGGPRGKTAAVTDIKTTLHADGTVSIDNVRAVKGLYDPANTDDQHAHEERSRIRKDAERNFGDYVQGGEGYPLSKRASDYAFGVFNNIVAITPRRLFDITKQVEDRSLAEALKASLPASLVEVEAGIFRSESLKGEQVAVALEAQGFHASEDLNTLLKGETASEEEVAAAQDALAQAEQAVEAAVAARAKKKPSKGSAPAGVISEDHDDKKVDRGPPMHLDANGDNIAIANDGMVSVYFKVEVEGGAKLDTVLPFLEDKGFPLKAVYASADHTAGCWFASTREASASDAFELLIEGGYTAKFYGCNQDGEALAPEDIKIVDTEAAVEIPIRPWNIRRRAWDALSEEEKTENRKTWKGNEFVIVCEYDQRTGCTLLITPRSYFYDSGLEKLYPEPLDLSHMLPADVKPLGDDGWYNSKSRDDNRLMHDMCVQRGFIDDWTLRLFLNQQGR
jgi:hypothetical protein